MSHAEVSFPRWGGWAHVFHCIVTLRGRSQLAGALTSAAPPLSRRPPWVLTPARCAYAALVALLPLSVLFQYSFKTPDHVNILELSARVVLEAVSRGRSSSKKEKFRLRLLAHHCLSASLSPVLLWLSTWPNAADAPSRDCPLSKWRKELPMWPTQSQTVRLSSDEVINETSLQEPLPQKAIDDTNETTRALARVEVATRGADASCFRQVASSRTLGRCAGRPHKKTCFLSVSCLCRFLCCEGSELSQSATQL